MPRLSLPKTKRSTPEAWLRTIVDAMVEALIVTDAKGRVVLVNRALEELVGHDVVGRRAKNVIDSDALRLAMRGARKERRATEVELETEIGGRSRTFRAQVSPLPRGSGAVAVLHDVTSLKDADRLRRDFVGNASHELRTPLTAIRGLAETLRDGALDDREAAARFLEAILRQTLRLQRLAEDLVLLARAESDEHAIALAPLDLRSIASDVAAGLEPAAKERRIALRLALPLRPVLALADERALEQILVNLVDNAIKYSPRGKQVIITVKAVRGAARIEVRDFGPGIAPEHQERVFERFYRVDEGRSREMGGTGLGLAIVRHLVARLDGRVSLESAPRKGALFRVELRRATRRRTGRAKRPRR